MACGNAVFVRDLPAIREFCTPGIDRLTCTAPSTFRDAIERLPEDTELRRRLGDRTQDVERDDDLHVRPTFTILLYV